MLDTLVLPFDRVLNKQGMIRVIVQGQRDRQNHRVKSPLESKVLRTFPLVVFRHILSRGKRIESWERLEEDGDKL